MLVRYQKSYIPKVQAHLWEYADQAHAGGPTAATIAAKNPHISVTVVDRDEQRIKAWKSRHLPIHEPGLHEVVRLARDGTNERAPNLFFSTACARSIAEADMILISVSTPTKMRGIGAGRATDMTAIEGAVRDITVNARPGTILVEKSTVPCKTGQLIKEILEAHRPGVNFPVLSNPEFLSEGTAIRDLREPDRIIIGCEWTVVGHRAAAALVNLYASWVPRSKIVPINIWSAELSKLVANAMLAQRISSINSISAICERTGADVSEIARTIGMDTRIGPQFLKAGLGFGGSCFRKDIASLIYLAESLGLPEVAEYWQQVLAMNDFQRKRFAKKVISCLNNTLRGKKIAILGFAFKKNTGDARESPALDVIRILLEESPRTISIFDPLCSIKDIEAELGGLRADNIDLLKPEGPIDVVRDPYTACSESNAILILTDWDMFNGTVPKTATILETESVAANTPAALLSLRQKEPKVARPAFNQPPTPPDTPQMHSLSIEAKELLNPEPPCSSDCTACRITLDPSSSKEDDIARVVDWNLISGSVKKPKWVFDSRNILDVEAMSGMGFRVETVGRRSMY